MNILRRILTYCFWIVLLIYATLLMAVRLPQVQSRLADAVEQAVSQKLGTTVRVGRIDLGFLNRVIIDSLSINDQQGEKMLSVGRMTARIEPLPLFEGKIELSSAQLFGAHAKLYQATPDSRPNFSFVLDSLASEDTTSHTPLYLHIGSIIVRNTSVEWQQRWQPRRRDVLDPSHLLVSGISAYIRLHHLTDTTLQLDVRRLACSEQSGMEIEKLAFVADIKPSSASLTGLTLQMPASDIRIDSLTATYESSDGRLFGNIRPGSLSAQLMMQHSTLTPSDLSPLLPQLSSLTEELAISMAASLNGDTLLLHHLVTDGLMTTRASGSLLMPTDSTQPLLWNADIQQLSVRQQVLSDVSNALKITDIGQRMGSINIFGSARGTKEKLADGHLTVKSDAGNADLTATIDHSQRFTALLNTDKLNLGRIADADVLGNINAKIDAKGLWRGRSSDISAKADISHLDVKGYAYRGISLTGRYTASDAQATLSIDDPNLQANVNAEANMPLSSSSDMTLTARVDNIVPHNLKLTDKGEDFALRHVNLNVTQQDGHRMLNVTAPQGNVHLTGRFDIQRLPNTLASIVCHRLPVLEELLHLKPSKGNDSFTMSAQLNDARWLREMFQVPLHLDRTINVMASADTGRDMLSLLALTPSFVYDGTRYSDGQLSITSPGDSLLLSAHLTRISDNGLPLDATLNCTAANEKIASSLTWDDRQTTEHYGGQINMTTQLSHDDNGKAEATVNIAPSLIVLKDAPWQMRPSTVKYTANRLDINHLAMEHELQHIIINGSATDSSQDTLNVDLHDIDVAYILDLVNFHSVDFDGQASGKALLTAPFGEMQASARLNVSNFQFEHGRMGTLYATALWNNKLEQIDINATANDQPTGMTYISGYVSPPRNYIDLDIRADGTCIEFMQSFTDAFLSQTTGQANGAVKLAGDLSAINLTGKLYVKGLAHVDALGVTYTLPGDSILLVPNDIQLNRVRLNDPKGATAYMSGGIHHDCLSALTFDLNVDAPEPLLAYQMANSGRDLFFGDVMAQGRVDMTGRRGEVVINVDATPTRGTAFTYNNATAEGISGQDFIEWTTHPQQTLSRSALGDACLSKNSPYLGGEPKAPLSRGDVGSAGGEAAGVASSDLRLNFRINATPEAELHVLMDDNMGDQIVLRGEGVMRATYYNKGTFQLFGTYRVQEGTYGLTVQNIIKKQFTFLPGGTIIFGGDPMQAALNLHAMYTVHGVSLSDLNIGNNFASNTVRVNCLMNVTGQTRSPQLNFDLELPTVNADEQQMVRSLLSGQQQINQQVVYLLGIGRFYNDQATSNQNTQQPDQTTLAMQSFLSGTLSTQVNTLLGRLIKNNNWNFGTNISTGTQGWYDAEYEGIVSGRMLNNRLQVNGQFGYRDNAETANSSFIGDFDIQYLLTPNGNLAVKMYNQTNDRYFTRSALNTQGLGLIVKRDFTDLRDLFGIRK